MRPTFKVTAAFVAIFLAGAVAGGFIGARIAMPRHDGPRPNPAEQFGPRQLERLTEGLELSEEQRTSILPILNETAQKLRALRRESFKQTAELFEAMDKRVAAILTPEQRHKLAAMQAEQKEKFQKFLQERGQRPDGRKGDRQPKLGEENGDMPPPPPPEEGLTEKPPQES